MKKMLLLGIVLFSSAAFGGHDPNDRGTRLRRVSMKKISKMRKRFPELNIHQIYNKVITKQAFKGLKEIKVRISQELESMKKRLVEKETRKED